MIVFKAEFHLICNPIVSLDHQCKQTEKSTEIKKRRRKTQNTFERKRR